MLYLNDQGVDFTGGDFIFNDKAKEGMSLAYLRRLEMLTMEEELERGRKFGRELTPFHPSRGAAVIFSSGWENMHEVYALESGTRYAVPSFFTTCPVPEQAYQQMHVGKPSSDEQIADDWLHLLLAHRAESPVESVGRVKELLMKWHYACRRPPVIKRAHHRGRGRRRHRRVERTHADASPRVRSRPPAPLARRFLSR